MQKVTQILLTLAIGILFIQNPTYSQGGSNYSIFGIGDIHNSIGAYYDGINGTSIAVPADAAVNFKNPALWSYNKNTLLQAGYKFNQHYNVTPTNELWQNNGKVVGIFGLFAIDTALGIAASFGITPYSSVNYLISSPVKVNIEELSLSGETVYKGLGGVNQIYIGASTKIIGDLAVGASIRSLFGKTSILNRTTFFDLNYLTSANLTTDSYKGWGFNTGIYYKMFDALSLGVFYENNSEVELNREMKIVMQSIGDSIISCEKTFPLGSKIGAGISYETGKFLFAADAVFQDFSKMDYQNNENAVFGTNTSYSFGVIRYGNPSFFADYLDKITYKFGIGYQELFYSINGNRIKEYSGSLGWTFPLPGTAYIDAAIIIGTRGQKESGLIGEYFGRLSIDIGISETWFKPFRRDY